MLVRHLVPETPIRTWAWRGRGAIANIFAVESFMDEMAERAGDDPFVLIVSVVRSTRVTRWNSWPRCAARAPETRPRDLPLTRQRVMAAMAW
jgi:CO/xanthine dehydrogenase Mo-binding subunit